MFKVRWFSVEPSGTYAHTNTAQTRESALAEAKRIAAELGMRALVLEKCGRAWHVAFDSSIGY